MIRISATTLGLTAVLFTASMHCAAFAQSSSEQTQADDDNPLPAPGFVSGYKYVGSNFSHKFHRPSCMFAKRIWTQHLELFHFRNEAITLKYSACNYCLPQQWTTVRAALRQINQAAATPP